ncbi:MAG TPA: transporter substrate-binding domain-containing protein [Bacteroidales bacterium]|nr:transporter substrate-binding domain-containing protein [Bacteroidales bacterium]
MSLRNNSRITDAIVARGKLIALTNYGSTSYFLYRGQPMGYQYDLLQSFAGYLGVDLEIVVNNSIEGAFQDLQTGKCDLIALDMAVTKDRKKIVDFSDPISQTRQVLVQRKPDNWRKIKTWDEVESHLVRNQINLGGKILHVQKNTFAVERLQTLQQEIGDTIYIVEEPEKTAEDLIKMVAEGDIDYTVCDEHIALINQHFYPDIDISTPVSFPQNVAWAVRKGSSSLQNAINAWLDENNRNNMNQLVYRKYFVNPVYSPQSRSSQRPSGGKGTISVYDDLIKEQSSLLNWDWRLLASLIYQESMFDPTVRSWRGAFGLMQLMPETARKFGVDSTSSPQENIVAGVKFLKILDNQLRKKVSDDMERIKFVLAAYNVGIAHILDAMRLAEKYGKDPSVWTDNVDYFILNKSNPEYYTDTVVRYGYARGEEPYRFVGEILQRYETYRGAGN